jgi:hypothetical protein
MPSAFCANFMLKYHKSPFVIVVPFEKGSENDRLIRPTAQLSRLMSFEYVLKMCRANQKFYHLLASRHGQCIKVQTFILQSPLFTMVPAPFSLARGTLHLLHPHAESHVVCIVNPKRPPSLFLPLVCSPLSFCLCPLGQPVAPHSHYATGVDG